MVAHLSFSHILLMLLIMVMFCALTGEFVIHWCSLSTVFRNDGGLDIGPRVILSLSGLHLLMCLCNLSVA